MSKEYFINKFKDVSFSNPLDICNEEERDYLLCLFGCMVTAVAKGQLNFNDLGLTPKERVVAFLNKV